jgi:hypothetical protein
LVGKRWDMSTDIYIPGTPHVSSTGPLFGVADCMDCNISQVSYASIRLTLIDHDLISATGDLKEYFVFVTFLDSSF